MTRRYSRYIKSKAWRSKRAKYKKSKLPKACVVCGEKKVDLHHKTYARLGYERLTDLVPMCRVCHKLAHKFVDAGRSELWTVHRDLKKHYKRHGSRPSLY